MNLNLRYFSTIERSEEHLCAIVQLLIESFDFYDMLPMDQATLTDLIKEEISQSGTECFDPLLALQGDDVVGVICHFPAQELEARQRASMMSVLRRLDRSGRMKLRARLQDKNYGVGITDVYKGTYVSRVAVSKNMRGQGIGSKFWLGFMGKIDGANILLHVDENNHEAIRFYGRFDFSRVDFGPITKHLMMRKGSNAT
jgi:ribosomal protein S18 acetylase RimI-like enzyme